MSNVEVNLLGATSFTEYSIPICVGGIQCEYIAYFDCENFVADEITVDTIILSKEDTELLRKLAKKLFQSHGDN